MPEDDAKKYAGLERHAITVTVMIIVALILWVGSGVQQAQVQLAAIEVELNYIKQQTTNDNNKFHEIEKRLDNIERQLQTQMDRSKDK